MSRHLIPQDRMLKFNIFFIRNNDKVSLVSVFGVSNDRKYETNGIMSIYSIFMY